MTDIIEQAIIKLEIVEVARQGLEVVEVARQGIAGASPINQKFTQPTPASTWIINHNLGYYPQITLLTLGMEKFDADVAYPNINQIVVTMTAPLAGSAIYN